jgi:hypothetical protein
MPWFPDFVSASELARRQTVSAGRADPVTQYIDALHEEDVRRLETVWPGRIVVHDPRAGEVHGHRQLRAYIGRNKAWLADRNARTETIASTSVGGRAVVELVAHLAVDGVELSWPVAVVAESPDERSVGFRIYCSQWPVDGRRHVRPAVLPADGAHLPDVIGRYHAAQDAGAVEDVVGTFGADGYFREADGRVPAHRGTDALRAFFSTRLGAGGVGLQACAVTDDGTRCAVEYNCVRWGRQDLPPQAGIGVYERAPDGSLTAARIYDDVEAPAG